jgi:hypothetical protein
MGKHEKKHMKSVAGWWEKGGDPQGLETALEELAKTRRSHMDEAINEAIIERAERERQLSLGLPAGIGGALVVTALFLFALGAWFVGWSLWRLDNLIEEQFPRVAKLTSATPTASTAAAEPTLAPAMTVTQETQTTATPSAWVLSGQVVKDKTDEGLRGVTIHLKVSGVGGWSEVKKAESGPDGHFQLEYQPPTEVDKCDFQLVVEQPTGWNMLTTYRGTELIWSKTADNPWEVEQHLDLPCHILDFRFNLAIRRTFSGYVYFEGTNPVTEATVELRYWDTSKNEWSLVDKKPINRPQNGETHIRPADFRLEHNNAPPRLEYEVSITGTTGPGSSDWAAGVPENVGKVQGSSIKIPVSATVMDLKGLVFAGPLPIRLTWKEAEFSPPYDPAKPEVWVNEDVNSQEKSDFPYVYRSDAAIGAWVRWPLLLPPGNQYEIWVGQPTIKNSAIVTYELLRRLVDDREGEVVEPSSAAEVAQCLNGAANEPEKLAGVYSPNRIGGDGAFWLKIDEGKAKRNQECKTLKGDVYYVRVPVWWVEVRRGKS